MLADGSYVSNLEHCVISMVSNNNNNDIVVFLVENNDIVVVVWGNALVEKVFVHHHHLLIIMMVMMIVIIVAIIIIIVSMPYLDGAVYQQNNWLKLETSGNNISRGSVVIPWGIKKKSVAIHSWLGW